MRREFHVRFCEGPRVQFPRATRLVIGFEQEDDAKRVLGVLGRRFEKYGLRLHPEKTRLLPFRRPKWGSSGKGPPSFDFLGFTVFYRRVRIGGWRPALKTCTARLRRAIGAITEWCRSHRHYAVKEQSTALAQRLNGHFNYYGVNGNMRSLKRLVHKTERIWRKWLNRRGQRHPLTWQRFEGILRAYPLPVPAVRVQLWRAP